VLAAIADKRCGGHAHLLPGANQASRRRHFRLETSLTPCVLALADAGPMAGQAGDIGGGGLLFVGKGHDLGAPIGSTGEIQFELMGEQFAFPVTLVRRMETVDRCELGLAWPGAQAREVDRLMYCLYKMELSRRNPNAVQPASRHETREPARTWRRDWLLVGALGIAGGALLAPEPVLPTLMIALALAVWLVTPSN
jgi:hypothetical protein